eukprot:7568774-Karenia_brevis.AAC.1
MHCRGGHRDFGRQRHALHANTADIGVCDDRAQNPRIYDAQDIPQPDWDPWLWHAVYINDQNEVRRGYDLCRCSFVTCIPHAERGICCGRGTLEVSIGEHDQGQ